MSNKETKVEIIIRPDGSMLRRNTEEVDIDVSREVIDQLSDAVVRMSKAVFEVPGWGTAHLCISRESSYVSVSIKNLPLKASFMIEDGVLFPRFSAANEPVLPMVWKAPDDMDLIMVIMLQHRDLKPWIAAQYLLAVDKSNKRTFRMPLGNLHDDGRLCAGEMTLSHHTAQAAMCAALLQLEKGQWQGDLDKNPAETKKMFRYKAENSAFVQLPSIGTWQESCNKIAPAIIKFINL